MIGRTPCWAVCLSATAAMLATKLPLAGQTERMPAVFMTTGSNVRLRAEPTTNSAVVSTLPLGTEVTAIASVPHAGWRRIMTTGSGHGWIQARFMVPFDPAARTEIVGSIVRPLLPARVRGEVPNRTSEHARQVVELVERALLLEADRERRADLSVLLLRAMSVTLGTISQRLPRDRVDVEAEAAWLNSRAALIQQGTAGLLVSQEFIRATHTRYSDTAAADGIAWFLAEQGPRGECEADVVCEVANVNGTHGDYLRLHPSGPHALQALAGVSSLAATLSYVRRFPGILGEFGPRRCADLNTNLSPLREATERATAPAEAKATALLALSQYSALCP
jgi:hypothetical protein